jgi:hypothetical protein
MMLGALAPGRGHVRFFVDGVVEADMSTTLLGPRCTRL